MGGQKNAEKGGVRVLIVDDSAYNRKMIRGMLLELEGIGSVVTASDGEEAIRIVMTAPPDAITLDLNMPRMDGFTFLRWLMKNRPLPVVVVSSEGGEKNVFKALDLGALDFVLKPVRYASERIVEIRDELLEKVGAIAGKDLAPYLDRIKSPKRETGPKVTPERRAPVQEGDGLLVVGASTGGPSAIQRVLLDLPDSYPFPVLVVQHMPPVFTRQFATRLERNTSLTCREAENGDLLLPGRALVAPGGYHLVVNGGTARHVEVVRKADGDRFVPSVDITMKSAVNVFGSSTIGVLLTGMGSDGAQGLLEIRKAGGITIAESEESAVVYGMPRAAVSSGAALAVLHLEVIGRKVLEYTARLSNLKNGRSDDSN
jgi:two-component system chemotaxis response regulator CheB